MQRSFFLFFYHDILKSLLYTNTKKFNMHHISQVIQLSLIDRAKAAHMLVQ